MQNRLVVLMLLLILVGIACGGSEPVGGGAGGQNVEAATAVAAIEVAPRDLSRELAVAASVEPRRRVRLASRSGGTLDQVGPEIGDSVATGEVVARLDMRESEAELDRAVAQEEEAELEYGRARELRERGSVSAAEYERARVARAIARSERRFWEARVDYGTVAAPRDGVIAERHVESGEAVAAGATLFELVAMDHLVLRPGVSEREVMHLEVEQSVSLRFDAVPDEQFEGRVARIFPGAERSSRLVTVEIDLPQAAIDAGVRPGFLGRVRTLIDHRPEALAVPAEAIGEVDDERYVYVIEDERLVERRVETGVTRAGWTQIHSGLAAGDIVLATNPIDMSADERVRIVGWRG